MKRQATDAVIEYPELEPWLEALKHNQIRNKHAIKYTQYTDVLVDTHKLFTIEDLVSLTGAELATVGNMEFGTASRIMPLCKGGRGFVGKGEKNSFVTASLSIALFLFTSVPLFIRLHVLRLVQSIVVFSSGGGSDDSIQQVGHTTSRTYNT